MPTRSRLITGQYYHVYNRRVEKRNIFFSYTHCSRFLLTLEHYLKFNFSFSHLQQLLSRADSQEARDEIYAALEKQRHKTPLVEVVSFCLMPNHFHLLLKQLVDNGISWLMHRLGTGFTEYFNIRQNRTGRLFEGSYKAKWVESEAGLLHLNRYQHINPKALSNNYRNLEILISYPWSSLATYVKGKNHPGCFSFVNPEPVLSLFKNQKAYLEFIAAQVDDFEPLRLDKIAIDDDFGWFAKFRALEKDRHQELVDRFLKASVLV